MCAVAKRFLSRCPAAAQRHSLLDRKFISVGIDQFHFASHDVRTVLDCLDCYLSHGGILKHQIPNPKHQETSQSKLQTRPTFHNVMLSGAKHLYFVSDLHGQKDYRLDVSQGFDLFATLQTLKVPSKMLYFPDEGHWVLKPQNSRLWYKTVNDWVDQWCKR